jgi:alpha-tubulin suppressor-like RCC1 family protein
MQFALVAGLAATLAVGACTNSPTTPDAAVDGPLREDLAGLDLAGDLQPPLRRDAGGPLRARALWVDGSKACVITSDRRVACWGFGGQRTPEILPGLQNAQAFYPETGCVIGRDGRVFCNQGLFWFPLNVGIPSPHNPAKTMLRRPNRSCVVDVSDALWCWGNNSGGMVGTGRPGTRIYPPKQIAKDLRGLAVGQQHACLLDSSGDVYCWGYDNRGKLGLPFDHPAMIWCNPTSEHPRLCVPIPTRVPGIPQAVAIVATNWLSCVVDAVGGATCWGASESGVLGTTRRVNGPRAIPTLVGVRKLTLGINSACALLNSGRVSCWGSNLHGQLGTGSFEGPETRNGTVSCSTHPVEVPGLEDVIDLGHGDEHVCALVADGRVACWGRNDFGQLGIGPSESKAGPVWVHGLGGPVGS